MKVVAVSQRVDEVPSYGEIRDSLDQNWHSFLAGLDCCAYPVPNFPTAVPTWLERVEPQAILLTGGNSVGDCQQRDGTETLLVEYGLENNLPILGVCRGMQFLAVHFGDQVVPVKEHIAVRHTVEGPNLAAREVNSFHGYAIESLSEQWNVDARATDGTVEAMSHKQYRVAAIMWHPERETPYSDYEFFRRFFV